MATDSQMPRHALSDSMREAALCESSSCTSMAEERDDSYGPPLKSSGTHDPESPQTKIHYLKNQNSPTPTFDSRDTRDTEDDDDDGGVGILFIDNQKKYSFAQREAMRLAKWCKAYLLTSFVLLITVSTVGLLSGGFTFDADNTGWFSRGTMLADRQAQVFLVVFNERRLFRGGARVWDSLIENVQPGWQLATDEQRRLNSEKPFSVDRSKGEKTPESSARDQVKGLLDSSLKSKLLAFYEDENGRSSDLQDRTLHANVSSLQTDVPSDSYNRLGGCNISWYFKDNSLLRPRLWPVWKVHGGASALDGDVLRDLCIAEENTQEVLMANNLCFGCGQRCLPPLSIVLYARLEVSGGLSMDCESLAEAWTSASLPAITTEEWTPCVQDLVDGFAVESLPASCSAYYSPSMNDELFAKTGIVEYTSSAFVTRENDVNSLYLLTDQYDKGSSLIEGAYDTQYDHFVNIYVDESLISDVFLGMISAFITAVAMLIHTRSPFLTLMGAIEIGLSFPMAFFIYAVVFKFSFFPQLNFLGIFIAFALGADHLFVIVDKWKNARLRLEPTATTPEVARKALPDAATAMWLTTSTTAVAFFASAVCPVAPIKLFGIFCGLVVTVDYVMDVVFIFPCLCIYDSYRGVDNLFMNNTEVITREKQESLKQNKNEEVSTSLIHGILLQYYNILHRLRWVLLVVCCVAFGLCAYFATSLPLPTTSEVRLLDSTVEFERRWEWGLKLLSTVLLTEGGSSAYVMWGTIPGDTGDLNDPDSWTQLLLDDTFDPSTKEAQLYLRDFCGRFFAEDFAADPETDFDCAINRFDSWLQEQSNATTNPDYAYHVACANATGLPLPPDVFHPCLAEWSYQERESTILSREGVVKIILIPFSSRVRFDSPNEELGDEWQLIEDWMQNDKNVAPPEVSKRFFSSPDFWWYDTNSSMLGTALSAASIAIAAAAVVVLLSSRSLAMTLLCVVAIGYVLVSVTSMMVAFGWTLGFLESICFSILIGISVDFVIHLVHAYVSAEGCETRGDRTKHALIHMGPSILAAAFTTLAASVTMLFAIIIFFEKFAMVLLFTILQATVAGFVVFPTMADCIGPSNPTYLADKLQSMCSQSPANTQLPVGSSPSQSEMRQPVMTDEADELVGTLPPPSGISQPVMMDDVDEPVGTPPPPLGTSQPVITDEVDEVEV